MFLTLNQLFVWLSHYTYAIIFPLAVVEGPIVTVLTGFLASLGQLNFYLSYAVVVAGDLVGDSLWYCVGRYSHSGSPPLWMKHIGVTAQRVDIVKQQFLDHPKKIFSLGKVSHGIGSVTLFIAGFTKFPFGQFLFYNLVLTMIKSYLLIVIGYHFGQAYVHIKTYLDYGAIAIAAIFIMIYLLFLRYTRGLSQHEDPHSH